MSSVLRSPGMVVLLVASSVGAFGQDQAEIDRTDPEAVARAYVEACVAGEAEAAMALLGDDERVLKGLRLMLTSWEGSLGQMKGFSWEGSLRESLCMPWPGAPGAGRALKDTTVEGDQARIAFGVSLNLDHTLVLQRDAEGAWAVNLVESAKASGGGSSYIVDSLEMLGGMAGDEAGGGLEAEASRDVLHRLDAALGEYAEDHDGRLPPAERWVDEIELYVLDRSAFRSPGAPDLAYGFAMNVEAGGRALKGFEGIVDPEEPEYVILFEWPAGERNATAAPEQVPETESFWPDGSVAYLTSEGEVDVLPKGMTLEEKLLEEVPEEEDEPGLEGPAMHMYRCQNNLRMLGSAARNYAREHAGMLPSAETWRDDLAPYILLVEQGGWGDEEEGEADPYRCPAADLEFGYAINAAVAGKNMLDIADQGTVVLFFEADLNVANAAGDPEQEKCDPGRHTYGSSYPGDIHFNQVAYLTGDVGLQGWPTELTSIFGDE